VIPPEVLNVLNVLGVLADSLDQVVVVTVGIGAKRLVAFEHDHWQRYRVVLVEDLAGCASWP